MHTLSSSLPQSTAQTLPQPSLAELERAAEIVYQALPPTPQYRWPLLDSWAKAEVWVKHENHTPVGAFKVRGGLVYFDALRKTHPDVAGVVAATRGNHGQSVAFAAQRHGLRTTIVVPEGNSVEKNAAMRAMGVELIEQGHDFQAALDVAAEIAEARGWHLVPSFHRALVAGVGTYALELFRAVQQIDTLYVPIGLGSGICGAIAARDALGLATEVVGVVSKGAPAYSLSFEAGTSVEHEARTRVADGMACRVPVPESLQVIRRGAARIVTVSDDEVEEMMRLIFSATHNVVEGAGAAAMAALGQERERMHGRRVAVVLSGANVDRERFAQVLVGGSTALP